MNKRPKSREETPKEGSDSDKRYRTTYCPDMQKPRTMPGLLSFALGVVPYRVTRSAMDQTRRSPVDDTMRVMRPNSSTK